MRRQQEQFGLHLIIMPESEARIPTSAREPLSSVVARKASSFKFGFKAFSVSEDHAHILVTASDEADIAAFINAVLDDTRSVVRAQGGPFRHFLWSDAVHVTLLPPWHIEILASFVRDQELYHETRSLEEELNEVFRPNASTVSREPAVN